MQNGLYKCKRSRRSQVNVYLCGDGKKKQLFGTYKVSVNEEIKKQTLDARGDDKLVYTVAVRLKKKTWKRRRGRAGGHIIHGLMGCASESWFDRCYALTLQTVQDSPPSKVA
jgi:hypothetical protein